jgi:hypothetical protein
MRLRALTETGAVAGCRIRSGDWLNATIFVEIVDEAT